MGTGQLRVVRLGAVEYRRALVLQQRLCAERQAEEIPDTLLLLEHPPVYTRGRRSGPGDLAMGESWYRDRGIEVVDVDRGGKVTYHAPGQLVGYPIMRTENVSEFVRRIERALVIALRADGLDPFTRNEEGRDFTGVWIGERKIASIGVHVAKGVTTHGFAVNVRNDLEPFGWIVPCGLADVQMTSVAQESGDRGDAGFAALADRVADALAAEHGLTVAAVSPDQPRPAEQDQTTCASSARIAATPSPAAVSAVLPTATAENVESVPLRPPRYAAAASARSTAIPICHQTRRDGPVV